MRPYWARPECPSEARRALLSHRIFVPLFLKPHLEIGERGDPLQASQRGVLIYCTNVVLAIDFASPTCYNGNGVCVSALTLITDKVISNSQVIPPYLYCITSANRSQPLTRILTLLN